MSVVLSVVDEPADPSTWLLLAVLLVVGAVDCVASKSIFAPPATA